MVLQTKILHYEFFHFFFLIQKKFLQPIFLTECPAMIFKKIEKNLTRPIQDERFSFRDFKSIFLKILAVKAWNPSARQQCQIGQIQAVSAVLPSWWIPCTYS